MTSPAMPRNDAALRYSPLIAAALAVGRTARAATRKSDVVWAKRRANTPTATVATSMARSPTTAATEVTRDLPPPRRGRTGVGGTGVAPGVESGSWFQQLAELVVHRLGVADVVEAHRDHQRVGADAED